MPTQDDRSTATPYDHPIAASDHDPLDHGATEHEAVLVANQAFYDAFEASDLDAMSEVWAHDPSTVCTHPGWGTLHGWAEISSSWFALFQLPSPVQFILTGARVRLAGEVAWVTVDENLIGTDSGTGETVAALNIFERSDAGWRMVCHHGSPVVPRPRAEP